MAFSDQAALIANTSFRARAKIAALTTAGTVIAQATPASGQLAAARLLIDSIDAHLDAVMNALITQTTIASGATDNTGATITDATLQTAMNAALLALVR